MCITTQIMIIILNCLLWIRNNAAISQLSSSSSTTNWNYGNNGFAIQRRYGLDADLR